MADVGTGYREIPAFAGMTSGGAGTTFMDIGTMVVETPGNVVATLPGVPHDCQ